MSPPHRPMCPHPLTTKGKTMSDTNIILPAGIPTWKVEDLRPYDNNPRTHSDDQINQLVASMMEFGFTNPILVDTTSKEIIAGHGRLMAAKRLGMTEVPVVALSHLNETQRRKLIIADNQLALNAGWDMDLLATELAALQESGESLEVLGFDEQFIKDTLSRSPDLEDLEDGDERVVRSGFLVEKFGVPPFSILEVRKGYWQNRKRAWRAIIGEVGESREGVTFADSSIMEGLSDVSLLDPVLCEIIFSWFGLGKGTKCVNPFAGDTTFGHVATYKGGEFVGIEVRQEQVDLNEEKMAAANLPAKYICDDGQNILKHVKPDTQDLLFCCPPYYDLEVYSDLPEDASNAETYEDFMAIMENGFGGAIKTLKKNRFAAIVVGNIRDKKTGLYRNFVNDMITLFQRHGMAFYNDIILVDALGSAPKRATHNMTHRKVVKVHQNVLIFYKGDPSKIKEIYTDDVFVDNFENNDEGEEE